MVSKQPFSKEQQQHLQRHVQSHVQKHVDKRLSEELVSRGELLGHMFKQHVSTAIIAAFSFLMALAWKDVIIHAVTAFVKEEVVNSSPYLPELIAAIVVTLIAILGIMLVTAWAKRPHIIITEGRTT